MEQVKRRFVQPTQISKHLYCSICQEVFIDPMVTKCLHTFCKSCVNQWCANKHKVDCPLCRKQILSQLLSKNLIAHQLIDDLHIFCPNRGCDWSGPLQIVPKHLQSVCKFKAENLPEWYRNYLLSVEDELQSRDDLQESLDVGHIQKLNEFKNKNQNDLPLAMRLFNPTDKQQNQGLRHLIEVQQEKKGDEKNIIQKKVYPDFLQILNDVQSSEDSQKDNENLELDLKYIEEKSEQNSDFDLASKFKPQQNQIQESIKFSKKLKPIQKRRKNDVSIGPQIPQSQNFQPPLTTLLDSIEMDETIVNDQENDHNQINLNTINKKRGFNDFIWQSKQIKENVKLVQNNNIQGNDQILLADKKNVQQIDETKNLRKSISQKTTKSSQNIVLGFQKPQIEKIEKQKMNLRSQTQKNEINNNIGKKIEQEDKGLQIIKLSKLEAEEWKNKKKQKQNELQENQIKGITEVFAFQQNEFNQQEIGNFLKNKKGQVIKKRKI